MPLFVFSTNHLSLIKFNKDISLKFFNFVIIEASQILKTYFPGLTEENNRRKREHKNMFETDDILQIFQVLF